MENSFTGLAGIATNFSNNDHETVADAAIKLSKQGYLLYANSVGIDFLRLLSKHSGMPAIRYLLMEYPYLLDINGTLCLNIKVLGDDYRLKVIYHHNEACLSIYLS